MNERNRLIELQRELQWRKATRDVTYFLESHYQIRHPARGMIPFELRQAQKEGLKHWMDNRYSLTLKARQIGWSTLAAAYSLWDAMMHPDRTIIMISRTEREAVDLLAKAKYGYKHLPTWMTQRGPTPVVDHQQKIIFDNDSSIISMPSMSDPARGSSASTIIVDEWAFLQNAEEAWASIEPVADVGGRIIGLSTANGSGNFFHQLWVGAQTGNNAFKSYFAPWSANTDRGVEWYAEKKRTTLPWILAQEYPENAEEAFIKSGRTVFDDLSHQEVIDPQIGYLHTVSSLKDFDWRPNHSFTADDPLRVWETPQVGEIYVIGADVAEGLEWGDYSSAHVINASTGEVAAHWHGHIPADLFGEELFKLSYWYNTALLGVESNNHGLTTITALRRLGHPRIYRRRRLNSAEGKGPMTEFGWSTTRVTKPLMIDELAMGLREGADDPVHVHCQYTLAELQTYVRDEKGQMGGSPFDDRVISLALAKQMLDHAFKPEYLPQEDDYMTLNWWANLKGDAPATSSWVIGQHAGRR